MKRSSHGCRKGGQWVQTVGYAWESEFRIGKITKMYCCNFMQFEGCHVPAGQEDDYSPMHLIGNVTLEKEILLGEIEHQKFKTYTMHAKMHINREKQMYSALF